VPDCAKAVCPEALILSSAVQNSASFFGSVTPALASTALEYQNQAALWMLTGTA
jgi:hypothetical protein